MKAMALWPAIACALAFAAPAAADGGDQTTAKIIVLHGTNGGKGIDPRIGKLPQLAQPPFSSYDSYALLDTKQLALDKARGGTLALPNAGKLKLDLKEVIADKGSKRFVVEASLSKPKGNKFLPVLQVNAKPGEIFFLPGQKYKKGILVLGIRVTGK